ncbi:MAG: hypothetical protein ACRD5B_05385, partial [Nitrososphaeraceae archaeon]
ISKTRIMFTAYLSYEQLKNQAEEDSNDGNTEQDISEEDGETTTTQEQETDTNFDENSPLLTALLEIKNKLDETLSKY